MSLSRILNDEPAPHRHGALAHVAAQAPVPMRNAVDSPSFIDSGPPRRSPPVRPYREHHAQSAGSREYIERSPSPRYYNPENHRSVVSQSPPPWSGPSGVSSKRISPVISRAPIPDDLSPHPREQPYESGGDYDGPNSDMYHPYPQGYDDALPPQEPMPEAVYYPQEQPRASSRSRRSRTSVTYTDDARPPPPENTGRKKKKIVDDGDYHPATRRSSRRQSSRTKQYLEMQIQMPSEAEMRLASSDLEDCREIWEAELNEYVVETQKRQRHVEMWFEDSCVSRNNESAQSMSRKYATRIAQIPPPPPRPQYTAPLPLPPRSPSPAFQTQNGLELEFIEQSPAISYRTRNDYNAANEDAARELEESVLGAPGPNSELHDSRKRNVDEVVSDSGSDLEVPVSSRRNGDALPSKKRRLDVDDDITDELERSIAGDDAQSISSAMTRRPLVPKAKGKGRMTPAPLSQSVVPVDLMGKVKKKPGPRKKAAELYGLQTGMASATGSVAGDMTPAPSVPPSPALSATMVYEFGDVVPPMKRAKRVDEQTMIKRIAALEEAQRKVWVNISRRDVAKVYKHHLLGYQSRQTQCKRTAVLACNAAKKPLQRTAKSAKDTQTKARRLMREMMVFWKKNEKEERDLRKRAEKEADSRAREEEEKREAARQARKLEFLISQTELYSHFVGNKLKTADLEGDAGGASAIAVPKGANGPEVDLAALMDINFDDDDETNLHAHARKNAQEAIELAKQRAALFDTQAALERKTNEALALAKAQAHIRDDEELAEGQANGVTKTSGTLVDLDSDELNFQNPTSLSGPLTITQPRMLQAQLKEYQVKGLNWLATLYEQGINGILADEMGLGKTVQSISLLAYLAETHDIWGPFLVVAPASTLHNWQQELTRFVPRLKALPYWGNVKDRATLRKFWSKKEISYNQDAPFHVLITSYQLVTQDQQYFQRVKWQYMILDEAQNIKNSSSVRWKTLLGFQCRNRLLLTGTPIQNNMQELWALLHFIMPSLFDSHDEFNEWFSKDIENAAAENKGSKLNEHQLRRLHMILKPFMLRRVKRHVQNELSEKIEIDIYVDLSARQRALYRALRANVSIADLLEKAANIGDADAARSLMNLVMQFRKVCNHPELFERADVVAPFSFCNYGRPSSIAREGDFVSCHYSTRSHFELALPEIFYKDGGILTVPSKNMRPNPERGVLRNLMNIWTTDYIKHSLEEDARSPFNFAPVLGLSPSELHSLHFSPTIKRVLVASAEEASHLEDYPYTMDKYFDASVSSNPYIIAPPVSFRHLEVADGLPPLNKISKDRWMQTCLSRPFLRWFVPPVIAPPPSIYSTDRNFVEWQTRIVDAPAESLALYGLPPDSREELGACESFEDKYPGVPLTGLIGNSSIDQLPPSYMQVPEAKRLIYDSAKLARLDALLHELKAGDHRVLIYFQMTRMMDLMEEYLIYRQYKYLRLDGSSKLEDRRDMVIDWQTRPDIFVFLLSTRAGGLGINLTAADTVVFYDHDWNPSNDAQAMDRAHRLGQTRQVTVYRLITKGTIDERIVQLARVKKDVQDIVVGNKSFTDVARPNEIVSLLLNDDELANLEKQGPNSTAASKKPNDKRVNGATDETTQAVRDLWAEEGDDFFGHTNGPPPAASIAEVPEEDDATPIPTGSTSTRGKRRRGGAAGGGRGRKPGPAKGSRRKAAGDSLPDDL